MSSEIQVFGFEDKTVRTYTNDQGEPWWILADVATILGYRDAANASRILRDKHKGTHQLSTLGGSQELATVSEPGLYRLMMRSNRPEAEKFQDWITEVVLPELRRTGRYEMPTACPDLAPVRMSDFTAALHRQALAWEAFQEEQEAIRQQQAAQAAALAEETAARQALEAKTASVEAKADAALASACGDSGYMALLGYTKLHGLPSGVRYLARVGGSLKRKCDAAGLPVRSSYHEIFGRVNLYPQDILDQWRASIDLRE